MLNPNSLTAKPTIGRSEYGRVKVALPRGKGFMDWVRLTTGKVYDITEYLAFHPGGIDELMRAAGGDATDLFNQFHAWVNYQSMLKACLVGKFSGDLSKLPKNGPSTIDSPKETIPKCPIELSSDLPIDFFRIEFNLNFCGSTLEVKFDISSDRFENLLKLTPSCSNLERKTCDYHKCDIEKVERLTHDVILFHLKLPSTSKILFAPGYHCSVKVRKGESVLYRPYTPISLDEDGIGLLVKIYDDGICTPALEKLKEGDHLEISDPIGSKNVIEWTRNVPNVVLLAAGTGITPMVDVCKATMTEKTPVLVMFNKTKKDLLTVQESSAWPLAKWAADERVKIVNVLSEEEAEGCEIGRVSEELIRKIAPEDSKFFICGPDGFVEAAKRVVMNAGRSDDLIHVFQG